MFESFIIHPLSFFVSGVVSVFPVMEEAAAQPESFVASAVLGPEATQDTLFELLVQDVKVLRIKDNQT